MDRPYTLTPEVRKKLLAAVRAGLPYDEAADLARVPRDTFANWRKFGRDPAKAAHWHELWAEVKEARAAVILEDILAVRKGEAGWKGKAWHAERLCPNLQATHKLVVEDRVNTELDALLTTLERVLPAEWYRVALRAIAGIDDDDGDGGVSAGQARAADDGATAH